MRRRVRSRTRTVAAALADADRHKHSPGKPWPLRAEWRIYATGDGGQSLRPEAPILTDDKDTDR